jgi:erythromycin esterase-like protein
MRDTTNDALIEAINTDAHPVMGAPKDYDPLMDFIGDARFVLLGEASRGTHDFYHERAKITERLIEEKGFTAVAVEADWPDAYRIHDFVTHKEREEPHDWEAFARFPTWMWRNQEVLDFIHWLRDYNLQHRGPQRRVGFYGLDLYSLFTSGVVQAAFTFGLGIGAPIFGALVETTGSFQLAWSVSAVMAAVACIGVLRERARRAKAPS